MAAGKAHLLLSEERARYRAEEEAKGLKIPGRGNHVRAAVSPTQEFLLLAEILWMQETRAPARKYSSDYLQYLQLVWELITGEPERSFAKAIRSYDKVMEKLRTRHKR